jgi:hypothetical protein
MSTITATVVADTTWEDRRLLTIVCDYPRFIHPQVMSYGMLRKSTSSSRAIPVKRQLELSQDEPFIPSALTKNQPGMGAEARLSPDDQKEATSIIRSLHNLARHYVHLLELLGVHKQHANRYLEPWLMTRCTITGAVEAWQHLLAQRAGPSAHVEVQPEMFELACRIRDAMIASQPVERQWHVPYCQDREPTYQDVLYAIARAARDSYRRDDVSPDFMGRLEKLAAEGHLGPFEHVAWYDTDAPGLAVGPYVLPSACDGDDLADEMLLNGWRSARHLGLDVVRQLLWEGR